MPNTTAERATQLLVAHLAASKDLRAMAAKHPHLRGEKIRMARREEIGAGEMIAGLQASAQAWDVTTPAVKYLRKVHPGALTDGAAIVLRAMTGRDLRTGMKIAK